MIREEMPRFDPLWTNRLPGFQRLVSSEAHSTGFPSYREDHARMNLCYQTKLGNLITWETAPISRDRSADGVTFVFAGGLGNSSAPPSKGFALDINGQEALRFDVSPLGTWQGADQRVELQFEALRYTGGGDPLGLFHLKVARERLKPGEPCRLSVRSLGSDSGRWFGLNGYGDVK